MMRAMFALLVCAGAVNAADPSMARYAVVHLYSHGGSATCVYTDDKVSYFVGCGHCEEPKDRGKRHGLEAPWPAGFKLPWQSPQEARSVVVAVSPPGWSERARDLSLIRIDAGPFPYVAPVAPRDWTWQGKQFVSCGYDALPEYMQNTKDPNKKLIQRPCEILKVDGVNYATKQRPWHGRSGGGLIDVNGGYLVGVVSRYEDAPGRTHEQQHQEVIPKIGGGYHPGIYSAHHSIVAFLDGCGYGWLVGKSSGAPQWQLTPPADTTRLYVEIPKELRIKNATGIQCGWVSVETVGRALNVPQLYGISREQTGFSDPSRMARVLTQRGVSFAQQYPGDKSLDFIRANLQAKRPVCVGLAGQHVQVCVGLSDASVWLIGNSTDLEVHEESLQSFMTRWDGWVVGIGPGEASQPRQAPRQRPYQQPPCPPGDT